MLSIMSHRVIFSLEISAHDIFLHILPNVSTTGSVLLSINKAQLTLWTYAHRLGNIIFKVHICQHHIILHRNKSNANNDVDSCPYLALYNHTTHLYSWTIQLVSLLKSRDVTVFFRFCWFYNHSCNTMTMQFKGGLSFSKSLILQIPFK